MDDSLLTLLVVYGVLPVAVVYVTKQIVNSLVWDCEKGVSVVGINNYDFVFPLFVLADLSYYDSPVYTAIVSHCPRYTNPRRSPHTRRAR